MSKGIRIEKITMSGSGGRNEQKKPREKANGKEEIGERDQEQIAWRRQGQAELAARARPTSHQNGMVLSSGRTRERN